MNRVLSPTGYGLPVTNPILFWPAKLPFSFTGVIRHGPSVFAFSMGGGIVEHADSIPWSVSLLRKIMRNLTRSGRSNRIVVISALSAMILIKIFLISFIVVLPLLPWNCNSRRCVTKFDLQQHTSV
jgi:hypothetical protein